MTKAATFQDRMFHDEDKAREALEAELWPNGPTCRHCGNADASKIAKMQGKSHRPGLYFCNECQGQFTVTVGTVLERSKIPLTKWLMAAHMFNSGKNGVSAHEIHRTLGVTYKTAWFMMHRLREAMRRGTATHPSARRATAKATATRLTLWRWSNLKGALASST
jgi:transposase-like protein